MTKSFPYIVIDIDGTFYDKFSIDDKKIIEAIFGGNIIVEAVDKILWKLNSLDLITNSMLFLKIRIMLYSILAFKSYNKVKEEYRLRYEKLFRCHIARYKRYIDYISKYNYEIVFITSNFYTLNAMKQELSNYSCKYMKNIFARIKGIKNLANSGKIFQYIGNNYMDDISIAKHFKLTSIYIGNSKLKRFFHAKFYFCTFLEYIINIYETF